MRPPPHAEAWIVAACLLALAACGQPSPPSAHAGTASAFSTVRGPATASPAARPTPAARPASPTSVATPTAVLTAPTPTAMPAQPDSTAAAASPTAGASLAAASATAASSASPVQPAATVTAAPAVQPGATAAASVTAVPSSPVPSAATPAPAPTPLRLVDTITTGQSLCDLVADPLTAHLYVTDDGPEQVLEIDPATHRQLRSFALQDSLCSVALDAQDQVIYAPTWRRAPDGRYSGGRVQAVDLDTGKISAYPADRLPSGPYFDAVGRMLYAGNTAPPSLLLINPAAGTVVAPIPLPAGVNRIVRSPISATLYLASPDSDAVLVYEPASRTIVATIAAGRRPWAVAADPNTSLLVASAELSGSVVILDPRTNTVIRTIPTGSHPRNLAVDATRGRIYILNAGSRTVSTLGADGRRLATSAALPGSDDLTGLATLSGSGQVFVVTKQQIFVLRPTGP